MPDIQKTGVLLMTYGSATTAEQVGAYMVHIFKDKIPAGVVEDFEERYRLVGSSPLVEITAKQAAFVEEFLNVNQDTENGVAQSYMVRSAMRHSNPFIEDVVKECRAAGAARLVGIILSPQFSSFIMEGYRTAFADAAKACGFRAEDIAIAQPWPTESHFVQLLATRVREAKRTLDAQYGTNVPVVFTTHSLPERVVAQDPTYLDQLTATIDAVRASLATVAPELFQTLEWYAAYQSAGHTPEVWLKPDLVDILAQLRDQHAPAVLIVPLQFLTDHLEILYDLDIAGKEQCDEFGIAYHRIELPNTAPLFIESLASIARTTAQAIFSGTTG